MNLCPCLSLLQGACRVVWCIFSRPSHIPATFMMTLYCHAAARGVPPCKISFYAKSVLCSVAKFITLAHVAQFATFWLLPQPKSQFLGLRPGRRITHTRLMVGGSSIVDHVHIITWLLIRCDVVNTRFVIRLYQWFDDNLGDMTSWSLRLLHSESDCLCAYHQPVSHISHY